MLHLLELPAEMLIGVFAASDTIYDAIQLSATNKQLHAIWMEHSVQIIGSVLSASIPAYKMAVDLATTEARLTSSIHTDDAPLLRHHLPFLLRNGELCKSACLGFSAHCEDAPSAAKSYYFLRRLALGYDSIEIRDELLQDLRPMSKEELSIPYAMSLWLWQDASREEKVRQGVEEEDYDPHDLTKEPECKWDYADQILHELIYNNRVSADDLKLLVEGYCFDPCCYSDCRGAYWGKMAKRPELYYSSHNWHYYVS